ncbi:pyridoxamine 5'-phosphate oxidase family protein [Candidatus Thorarchaeota archaeon]|nr:MAG: pyridoxamine 5'-phosphate oxidase family protein [Candidatus Thorarchaeota archaeon]
MHWWNSMSGNPLEAPELINLLSSQLVAVLSTSEKGEPYSCLVSFEATDDLHYIVFATMRQRLKYRNMLANPRVSLMVDNRENKASDLHQATSVSILGTACDTEGKERERFAKLLLARHPELEDFVSHPDCAVIAVEVDRYYVVTDFESVNVIEVKGE